LGGFSFAGLLCRDFHSPQQGTTPQMHQQKRQQIFAPKLISRHFRPVPAAAGLVDCCTREY